MPIFNLHTGEQMVSSDKSGLLLCVDGNACLRINGIEYKFSRNGLCVISPFLFTEIVSSSPDCKWEMICDDTDIFLAVTIQIFKSVTKNNLIRNPYICLNEKQVEKFLFFADMINEKEHIYSNARAENSMMIRQNIILLKQAAGMEFISLYLMEYASLSSQASHTDDIVYNFIFFLAQNYTTHRDIGWYAKQANVSPTYFSQIVHQKIGYSPTALIRHITVATAKMLLAQPRIAIKEVAYRLNYSDQFSFRKFFKSCTGISPSQYRKSLIGQRH